VGLMWGLGTPSRSARSLAKINSSDLSTDWGTRSIGISTPLFEPLNYNYGAVWPFLTSWVAAAQYRHHQPLQGFASLMTSVRHTFDNGAGVVTEVFSGYQNVWPREAVAHQGFCTAGVMLPAVRGLLGLDGDALRGTLAFSPALPADWDTVSVTSYRTGGRSADLTFVRTPRRVELIARVSPGGVLDFRFAPTLSPGTVVRSVNVNGLPASCTLDSSPQYVRPLISIALKDSAAIAIDITPGLEILPPRVVSRTGDTNAGLKIVASELVGTRYAITVEGLSGREYLLGVANPEIISSVRGGHLRGTGIAIPFPDERPGAFVRKDVVIVLKDPTTPR
jgi:hypothetical protein